MLKTGKSGTSSKEIRKMVFRLKRVDRRIQNPVKQNPVSLDSKCAFV